MTKGRKRPVEAIRTAYEQHGVRGFYSRSAAEYRNPHEPAIVEVLREAARRWPLDLSSVLDLACGSGEVTLVLRALGAGAIHGIDPYTGVAYQQRTGQAAEPLDFEAIAVGALEGRRYSLIACSFALHLAPVSRLPALAYALSRVADTLLVITPHKRPEIKPAWGWALQDEFLWARVRARYYQVMSFKASH